MGYAFVAGLKNEAPRGRDMTNEDRNSEVLAVSRLTLFNARRGGEPARLLLTE